MLLSSAPSAPHERRHKPKPKARGKAAPKRARLTATYASASADGQHPIDENRAADARDAAVLAPSPNWN